MKKIITVISFIILITVSCKKDNNKNINHGKIISLAPSLTKVIIDLKLIDNLVGVTEHCRHHDKMLQEMIDNGKIKIVSGFNSFDYERILMLNPEKVLVMDSVSRESKDTLEKMIGLEKIISFRHPRNLDEINEQIIKVASIFNVVDKGQTLINNSKKQLELITKIDEDKKPTVLIEIYNSPYMAAGTNTFLADMVRIAGGKPAFEIKQDWASISLEEVISKDPDIIIKTHPTGTDLNLFKLIRAYRDNNIYIPIDVDSFLQPGFHTTSEIVKLNSYFTGFVNKS